MKIGVPKEIADGETRVALIPSMIGPLLKMNHEVLVESGAGLNSGHDDTAYKEAGAQIADAGKVYAEADVLLKVQPLTEHPVLKKHEADLIKDDAFLITFLSPTTHKEGVKALLGKKVTAFDMGFVPRITRAQSMDALSSMATLSGYKAVLLSANYLGKIFPLMMTAAGTIAASQVLVLGAGVAGLQAIATAKRLGARVEAFDPRPVVKEQVESLGGRFVEMEMPEDAETEGGYAKEMDEAFLKKEQEAIASRLKKTDVVITTAQVFGKAAPILITEEMVRMMPAGSVIIDIAAEQGGNTALTEKNKLVEKHGVKIYGAVNLPALLPVHASQMYSKNITTLFRHLFKEEEMDWEDEITKGACVIRDGKLVNSLVEKILNA